MQVGGDPPGFCRREVPFNWGEQDMRRLIKAVVLGATALLPLCAFADTLSFTYTDAADGNLVADFSIDVVNGYAVSGTGTVTSTLLGATDTLNLVTFNSTLPAGDGGINVTNTPVTNGFTWHTVPGSTGPDFLADNVVNEPPAPLSFDTYGVVFSISNAANSIVGGLNIFDGSPTFAGYSDNFSGGGQTLSYAAQGTLAPVPLPAGAWLLLSGLGCFGAFSRRKLA
jgi:hypothetical protein